MGPKGYETIKGALHEAGLATRPAYAVPSVLVTPQITAEEEAAEFITIQERHVPHAKVLNALDHYVSSGRPSARHATSRLFDKGVMLKVVGTSSDSITFVDLNYPRSE